MEIRKFNWQIWVGFLLSVVAFLSYPSVFVRWPITRDFPWANLLLFGVAAVLLFVGVRRAFSPDRRLRSKIAASILTIFSFLVLGFFVFSIFVASKWLPASHGAPQIGQKAPDFTLADTSEKPMSLSELLRAPINAQAASINPRGVLLIFYRGYW
jgi:uncharacterized membrane protein YhaH (DUF805 family)